MVCIRFFTALLLVCCAAAASADVWKWVDTNGKTHFVDSDKSIYTWRDETGRVFYSDKKDHETAVLVQLVWHSSGSLADVEETKEEKGGGSAALPGETPEQRAEREAAEAYYCKRATEIYDAYVNAPRLYETGDDGAKVYLSDKQAEAVIEETRQQVEEICK